MVRIRMPLASQIDAPVGGSVPMRLALAVAADAALEVGASGDALRRDDRGSLQDQPLGEQVGGEAFIDIPLLGLPLDQDEPPLHRAHRGRPPSTFLSHSSPSELLLSPLSECRLVEAPE